ncbi:HAD family hydrolase [Rhodococcus sp. NPDC003348]
MSILRPAVRAAVRDRRPDLYSVPVTANTQESSGDRRVAAFFDLDKTIIAKSSILAFSKPFFEQGLINRRAVLKSSYAQFLFLVSGADHDQTERMRVHLTNMCAGWDVDQVRTIVAETLHDIVDPLVFSEAADLIADHKARGHDVIVVSASGEEVVTPIAQALGADHSAASRMAVKDGRFTGDLEFYCHGEGKARAIRELAATHGYDLDRCYAYSDSSTDLPMLEAVGHPTAVNPDRTLRKEATEKGWPVLTFSNPVPLRARLPSTSTTSTIAATAVGFAAVAAGAVTYGVLRRRR